MQGCLALPTMRLSSPSCLMMPRVHLSDPVLALSPGTAEHQSTSYNDTLPSLPLCSSTALSTLQLAAAIPRPALCPTHCHQYDVTSTQRGVLAPPSAVSESDAVVIRVHGSRLLQRCKYAALTGLTLLNNSRSLHAHQQGSIIIQMKMCRALELQLQLQEVQSWCRRRGRTSRWVHTCTGQCILSA